MPDRRTALTPDALVMIDTIARTGSFAAAARELGKVPSALTYNVRQLEDALDVLLFDRRSRQAQLTAAGAELLHEGRRLLQQMDAVANRVRRVATGWEAQLTLAVDAIVAPAAIFDLVEAFYAIQVEPARVTARAPSPMAGGPPPTRLKLMTEVLSGTWEALVTGEADLAIGLTVEPGGTDIDCLSLGAIDMPLTVAPHHPLAAEPEPVAPEVLARHRVIAVADSAHKMAPVTVGVLPGQDVLTVPTMSAKLAALLRGLGCGRMPEPLVRRHIEAGRLVHIHTQQPVRAVPLHFAWRRSAAPGLALQWWLQQLRSEVTRRALVEQHAGLVL